MTKSKKIVKLKNNSIPEYNQFSNLNYIKITQIKLIK